MIRLYGESVYHAAFLTFAVLSFAAPAVAAPKPEFHFRSDLTEASGFPVYCESLRQFGYSNKYTAGVAVNGTIVLSPMTCRGFDQPRFHRDSLITLGHERAHLLGVRDESAAERKGVHDAPWLARRLRLG